jgi:cysteinyl-tRNA synthetase
MMRAMTLQLFNSLTRTKEKFAPQGEPVKIYTCGPTVYAYAHIGNFRTYVFEDLLRRTLKFLGHRVEQAQNLTDVDDKTIRGAIGQRVGLHAYTQTYIDAFFEDLDALGIERAEHYPRATDYIPQMIELIQQLLDKGAAYRSQDGSIYFSIAKFPKYGALAHLKMENLAANASGRIAEEEYERDQIADFVLWKAHDATRDGTIFWESPFGRGRPGWHLECSAMALSLLGPTLDIHVGGVDNLFPHHENEIAQSEAATGIQFARTWLHAEHLIVDGRKMSKSLGNFFTLRDLLAKGYTGAEVRWLLLQGHYRMPLNFTQASLEAARSSLQRLRDCLQRLATLAPQPDAEPIAPRLDQALSDFRTALCDDLNASAAIAVLFDLVRELHTRCDNHSLDQPGQVLAFFAQIDRVLNVLSTAEPPPPAAALALLEQRQAARAARNWPLADQLRDQLSALNYTIEDTATGPRLKRKS